MPEHAPRVEPEEALFELVRPRWQARAACHPDVIPHIWQQFDDCDHPVDLFYPTARMTAERLEAIAQVCGTCPVRQECHAFGRKHEKNGWWGGMSQDELDNERNALGLPTPPALEVDSRTRKVIGTFIMPGHGSPERYNQHIQDGDQPCELCTSAHAEFYKPQAAEEYAARRARETPEERIEKNRLDRIRRNRKRDLDRKRNGSPAGSGVPSP